MHQLIFLLILSLIAVQDQSVSEAEKNTAPDQAADSADADRPRGPYLGVSYSNPVKFRWRVGLQMRGGARSSKNFLVTIPVPTDWPEQVVQLFEEDIPPEVQSVEYRDLNSGVRQLVMTIPKLRANQLITATVTFDVRTHQINAPDDTTVFSIPPKASRDVKEYLGVGPGISYRNAKVRNLVKELIAGPETDWDKVEAIYDWVRENIEYREVEPSDSLNVFRKKIGCAEDLVGLFVAMCRAAKVPARMVWVEGAQYAEFFLVDPSGTGHWFPCSPAGRREFGSNAEPRIIQQKGDNIKVPEKQQRQKYCAEFVTGSGKVKPIVKFVRDLLPAN